MTSQADDPVCCDRHADLPANLRCSRCGRPICRECISEFGYFCGPDCLAEAKASISEEDRDRRECEQEAINHLQRRIGLGIKIFLGVMAIAFAIMVWRVIFRPPGKVCWTWAFEGTQWDLRIAAATAGELWVKAGPELVRLRARDGREETRQSSAGGENHITEMKPLGDDRFLALSGMELSVISLDGSQQPVFRTEAPINQIEVAPDGSAVAIATDRSVALGPVTQLVPAGLTVIDLADAAVRWEWQPDQEWSLAEIACNAAGCFVLAVQVEDETASYRLTAFSWSEGKPRWEVDLPSAPVWGPVATGNRLFLQVGTTFFAFAEDGTTAWKLPVEGSVRPESFALNDRLYLVDDQGTVCYDSATGSRRWRTNVQLADRFVASRGKRLLVTGFTGAAAGAIQNLPPAYRQMDDIIREMGGDAAARGGLASAMQDPALFCLDDRTGEVLWEQDRAVGQMFLRDDCLVQVFDSSDLSLLEMVAGGRGATIIEQFNPANGKSYYRRQLDIGFEPFGVVAGRLVGIAWERSERVGLIHLAQGATDTDALAAPGAIGVVGIRLKR